VTMDDEQTGVPSGSTTAEGEVETPERAAGHEKPERTAPERGMPVRAPSAEAGSRAGVPPARPGSPSDPVPSARPAPDTPPSAEAPTTPVDLDRIRAAGEHADPAPTGLVDLKRIRATRDERASRDAAAAPTTPVDLDRIKAAAEQATRDVSSAPTTPVDLDRIKAAADEHVSNLPREKARSGGDDLLLPAPGVGVRRGLYSRPGEPRAGEPRAGEPRAGEPRASEPRADDEARDDLPTRPIRRPASRDLFTPRTPGNAADAAKPGNAGQLGQPGQPGNAGKAIAADPDPTDVIDDAEIGSALDAAVRRARTQPDDERDDERDDEEAATEQESPQRPRWMSLSRAALLIGVLCGLLGFGLAVQVQSNSTTNGLSGARQEDLVRILDDLSSREERLRRQISSLEAARSRLTTTGDKNSAALVEAKARSQALGVLAGTLAAQGPGIQLTMTDPEHRLQAEDILDAVEELRAAGAEALQVGQVRIGLDSAFTDGDGTNGDTGVLADGEPLTTPYRILAIGDPATLATALNIPGGVVDTVRQAGGQATINQEQRVVIRALRSLSTPHYAQPAE
jgi:uncharacterized protein YlxW (UPF0749 family)